MKLIRLTVVLALLASALLPSAASAQDTAVQIPLWSNPPVVAHLDTGRIGTLGFSAGGEVADILAYTPGLGDPAAPDPVDRLNGRPNFQMLVYPGPLGVPNIIPADAPPAFVIAADDDPCCAVPVVSLLERYRAANVPVEAHILNGGKHGFNMGYRSDLKEVRIWPQLMANWLSDMQLLHPGKK
jgi:acetyl esterase/lipase